MKTNDSSNEIIIYEGDGGKPRIEVRITGDTVWLTQAQLSELFDTTKQNVSLHIKNILEEGELSRQSTVKEFLTVRAESDRKVQRSIEHYNLDMIISLGYRVKSTIATRFRQWTTVRLREYIIKGFTIDDDRLKGTGGGDLACVFKYLHESFRKEFYVFGARDHVGKELVDAKKSGVIRDILFAEDFDYRLDLRRP